MPVCRHCGLDKEPSAFYASSPRKCKECVRKTVHENRERNIERIRAYDRERDQRQSRKEARRNLAWRYKERKGSYIEKWVTKNPEKRAAHEAVRRAVRSGILKKLPCEHVDENGHVCGAKAQAHHDDYSKPLDVIWLCPEHHGERHRWLNEMARQAPREAAE